MTRGRHFARSEKKKPARQLNCTHMRRVVRGDHVHRYLAVRVTRVTHTVISGERGRRPVPPTRLERGAYIAYRCTPRLLIPLHGAT